MAYIIPCIRTDVADTPYMALFDTSSITANILGRINKTHLELNRIDGALYIHPETRIHIIDLTTDHDQLSVDEDKAYDNFNNTMHKAITLLTKLRNVVYMNHDVFYSLHLYETFEVLHSETINLFLWYKESSKNTDLVPSSFTLKSDDLNTVKVFRVQPGIYKPSEVSKQLLLLLKTIYSTPRYHNVPCIVFFDTTKIADIKLDDIRKLYTAVIQCLLLAHKPELCVKVVIKSILLEADARPSSYIKGTALLFEDEEDSYFLGVLGDDIYVSETGSMFEMNRSYRFRSATTPALVRFVGTFNARNRNNVLEEFDAMNNLGFVVNLLKDKFVPYNGLLFSGTHEVLLYNYKFTVLCQQKYSYASTDTEVLDAELAGAYKQLQDQLMVLNNDTATQTYIPFINEFNVARYTAADSSHSFFFCDADFLMTLANVPAKFPVVMNIGHTNYTTDAHASVMRNIATDSINMRTTRMLLAQADSLMITLVSCIEDVTPLDPASNERLYLNEDAVLREMYPQLYDMYDKHKRSITGA